MLPPFNAIPVLAESGPEFVTTVPTGTVCVTSEPPVMSTCCCSGSTNTAWTETCARATATNGVMAASARAKLLIAARLSNPCTAVSLAECVNAEAAVRGPRRDVQADELPPGVHTGRECWVRCVHDGRRQRSEQEVVRGRSFDAPRRARHEQRVRGPRR